MKRITDDELKKITLHIMDFIDSICQKYHINYSLAGGSLLGAARHKGFIPWDDDFDIILQRNEYCRLINILKKHKQNDFVLLDFETKGYKYPFAKLCFKNSFSKSSMNEVDSMGIFVDIFPADGIPDIPYEKAFFETQLKKKENSVIHSNIHSYFASISYSRAVIKMIIYFPLFIKSFVKGNTYNQLKDLENFMSSEYPFGTTDYCGFVCSRYFPEKEKYPTSIFREFIRVEFEGRDYSIFKDYDVYLRQLYGVNFMQLPPENVRTNHNFYKWYWRNI